uniref:Uncharacterized protein n=1 Tax=Echeneis naucrates TaxID=173247 RepID=A0A665TTK0_ECHNA
CFGFLQYHLNTFQHQLFVPPPFKLSFLGNMLMYIIELGCLLLSVLGIFGACKGKRWCLILLLLMMLLFHYCWYMCSMQLGWRRPTCLCGLTFHFVCVFVYARHLQFECCGLIEGYKDWGSFIPASCNCHYPGKCVSISLRETQNKQQR